MCTAGLHDSKRAMSDDTGRKPSPPPARDRMLVLLAVVAIIIISSVIFLMIRVLGGDDPAPQLDTVTVSKTRPMDAAAMQPFNPGLNSAAAGTT